MKRVHQKELKSKRTHTRRAKAKRLRHRGHRDQRSSTPRALRPEPESKPETVSRRPLVEEETPEVPALDVEVGPTAEELEAEETQVQETATEPTAEVRPKTGKEVIEVSNAYSL